MELEKKQVLMHAALWTLDNKHINRRALCALVGAEENCVILLRELDRVLEQVYRARSMRAEATLTLVEWLDTLNHFDWLCAYCQSKPFRVLTHFIALPIGGTTSFNCVPACFACRSRHNHKENIPYIQAYLAMLRQSVEIALINEQK